jgi:hypothetical protein
MSRLEAEIEQFIERVGETINGQFMLSYRTRQTIEEFLDSREKEAHLFDEELFLDYVLDNVADVIKNEVLYNGDKSLKREITLLDDTGREI